MAGNAEIVYRAVLFAVENQDGLFNWWPLGGEVQTSHRARSWLDQTVQQTRGAHAIGSDNDGTGGQSFAAAQHDPGPVNGRDPRPRTQRTFCEAAGQLIADRTHAASWQGRVAGGKHAEDELEHTARSLEASLEKDTAEEGSHETFDHLS